MTLTQQEKLVSEERKGFGPKPGHDIVVYELIESGLRFDRVLTEGKVFEPKKKYVFGKPPEYASWAVNKHPSLRFEFTARFDHMGGGHSFDLIFTLLYAADDTRLIVANLVNDPLKMVQSDVRDAIGPEVAKIPWDILFASKLKDNFEELAKERVLSLHKLKLIEAAKLHGIKLNDVKIKLALTNEDVSILAEASKREREKRIAELKHIGAVETIKYTTNLEGEKLTSELSLIDKQQELERRKNAHNREQKMQDVVVSAAGTALGNMAEETRSPEGFIRASEAVMRTFQSVGSRSNNLSNSGPVLESGNQRLLAVSAPGDALEEILREALDTLGPSHLEGETGRDLLSATLHWIAELYRGLNANPEVLEFYKDRLSSVASELNNEFSSEQYEYIRKLMDSDSIRARLTNTRGA
jgi:hypothetical protein